MSIKFTDFELLDQNQKPVRLSNLLQAGPVMLVFYPGDFTPVCTKQLCGYRDADEGFKKLGIQIVGISPDSPQKHLEFIQAMNFQFSLLSDPEKKVFAAYKMLFMFGMAGRGNVLISRDKKVLYQYAELVPITHRKKEELLEKFEELLGKTV